MALGFAIAGKDLSASSGIRDNNCSKSTAEQGGKLEGKTEIGAAACEASAR